jgi:hypothetical protein
MARVEATCSSRALLTLGGAVGRVGCQPAARTIRAGFLGPLAATSPQSSSRPKRRRCRNWTIDCGRVLHWTARLRPARFAQQATSLAAMEARSQHQLSSHQDNDDRVRQSMHSRLWTELQIHTLLSPSSPISSSAAEENNTSS